MTILNPPPVQQKKEKSPLPSSLQSSASSATAIATASYFSGPIPPPEHLKQYEA